MRTLLLLSIPALMTIAACGGGEDSGDAASNGTADSTAAVEGTVTAPAGDTAATGAASAAATKIDLNTATEEQFRTIPGVGDKMVHEFEEYRPYRSIAQFRKEIGKYVDAATVAEYEKYVFVPVDPNASDAETLQQIPGIDATEAPLLIDARPFASTGEFLEKMGSMASPEEVGAASAYLATAQ